MMAKMDFRKLIEKNLKKQKMNIPELARKVQLNPQTIYNYMTGSSQMTAANLENIFDVQEIKF
jgi:predicted transcriptional regulator